MSLRFCRSVAGVVAWLVLSALAVACTAAGDPLKPDRSDWAGVAKYYSEHGFNVAGAANEGEVDVDLKCSGDPPSRTFVIDGVVGDPLVRRVTTQSAPGTYSTKSFRFTQQPTDDEVSRDQLCHDDPPAPPAPTIATVPAPPAGAKGYSAVEQQYQGLGFDVVPLGYTDYFGVWLKLGCGDRKPRWFEIESKAGSPLVAVRTSQLAPDTVQTRRYTFTTQPGAGEVRREKLCDDGRAADRVFNVPQLERALLDAQFKLVRGSGRRGGYGITFAVDLGCDGGLVELNLAPLGMSGAEVPAEFDPAHPRLSDAGTATNPHGNEFSTQPSADQIRDLRLCAVG